MSQCESVFNILNRSPYQNTKALIFIKFEQMTVKLSYMPTTPVPLCVLSIHIQPMVQYLACNLNVTSRVGDLSLMFKIVRNKNGSPENFPKVTMRSFDIKPMLYQFKYEINVMFLVFVCEWFQIALECPIQRPCFKRFLSSSKISIQVASEGNIQLLFSKCLGPLKPPLRTDTTPS